MSCHELRGWGESGKGHRSIRAPRILHDAGFFEFASSRAYYAAFYAATAAMLVKGLEASRHNGLIALVHRELVRPGELAQEHGRALNWLFELRAVADYGLLVRVSSSEAQRAIDAADRFVQAIESLLGSLSTLPEA